MPKCLQDMSNDLQNDWTENRAASIICSVVTFIWALLFSSARNCVDSGTPPLPPKKLKRTEHYLLGNGKNCPLLLSVELDEKNVPFFLCLFFCFRRSLDISIINHRTSIYGKVVIIELPHTKKLYKLSLWKSYSHKTFNYDKVVVLSISYGFLNIWSRFSII